MNAQGRREVSNWEWSIGNVLKFLAIGVWMCEWAKNEALAPVVRLFVIWLRLRTRPAAPYWYCVDTMNLIGVTERCAWILMNNTSRARIDGLGTGASSSVGQCRWIHLTTSTWPLDAYAASTIAAGGMPWRSVKCRLRQFRVTAGSISFRTNDFIGTSRVAPGLEDRPPALIAQNMAAMTQFQ